MKTVAPSPTSARASAAVLTRLSIAIGFPVPFSKCRALWQQSADRARAPRALPRGPPACGLDVRLDQFDDAAHVKIAMTVRDVHGIGSGRRGAQRCCRAGHLGCRL